MRTTLVTTRVGRRWPVVFVLLIAFVGSPFVCADEWDLARDFAADRNDVTGVWQYFCANDGNLDGSYDRLDRFTGKVVGRPGRSSLPFVAKNVTDRPIDIWGPGQGTVPPQSVAVHPEAHKYGRFHAVHVAVGWKSPLTGRVDIRGRLYMAPDVRDAGYGVDWYLDRGDGTTVLVSGTLAINDNTPGKGDSIVLVSVPVATGETLYLIVAARDWIELDTTIVSLRIRPSQADPKAEKGVGSHLPERPVGCFAQMRPDPFFALDRAHALRSRIPSSHGLYARHRRTNRYQAVEHEANKERAFSVGRSTSSTHISPNKSLSRRRL